jgi:toxin ParE1/3/4
MSRYRLSGHARDDLDEIWLYIAADDPPAADRFIDRLIRKVGALSESPGIGQQRPELGPELRSFPVGCHVIFYRVAPDAIDVIRIISGYRDLPAVFSEP